MPDFIADPPSAHIPTDESPALLGNAVRSAWGAGAGVSVLGSIPASVAVHGLSVSGFGEYPSVINLIVLCDGHQGWRITDLNATSLRIVHPPVTETVEPTAETALDDLARWTELPTDGIAYLVGASRRSIYNWRKGSTIPDRTAPRIIEARRAVEPLAALWPAPVVGRWLTYGEPSPGQLAHEQRWPELNAAVHGLVTPTLAQPVAPELGPAPELDSLEFSAAARQAILSRFSSATELGPRRPGWRPREETGLGEDETDED
jgi:hypothetical protein